MDESSCELERQIREVAGGALDELVKPGKAVNTRVTPNIPDLVRFVDSRFRPGHRECLHAGLWILADELDRAHTISQEIPNIFGSAWHAVVHRREGDFWNSKYWWRRASGIKWEGLAGRIRSELPAGPAAALRSIRAGSYDPASFVDLVESQHNRPIPDMQAPLVTIQRLEWLSLFSECLRAGE